MTNGVRNRLFVHQKEDRANYDIESDQAELDTLENIAFWICLSDKRPLCPAYLQMIYKVSGRLFCQECRNLSLSSIYHDTLLINDNLHYTGICQKG